jgi:prepilin-type N-terminal cleavage/methylation domain-containing protein
MTLSRARGYSLVELVVVVALILVLTAMIVPVARFNWTRMKEMEL